MGPGAAPRERGSLDAGGDVDPSLLRRTMGGFATGIAVVTTEHDGVPCGMSVNSLTSVSLVPPLLLVCLTRDARTTLAIRGRGAFAVNLLGRRQESISDRFAARGGARFDDLEVPRTPAGLPCIPGGLGRLDCVVEDIHEGGDHLIVVGRVVGCEFRDGTPLIFFRGRYHELGGEGREVDWYW
jgi:flavin reductase (DIM6/NTAB) family NADH-FMN oxidoreductase RutF